MPLRSFIFDNCILFFFFNDTATTEIYTLSLHDALPISQRAALHREILEAPGWKLVLDARSEEHTSELQSRRDLVCRLLLEKKKNIRKPKPDNNTNKTENPNTINKVTGPICFIFFYGISCTVFCVLFSCFLFFFFFNDTATTEIYTLSLHDALPISPRPTASSPAGRPRGWTSP